MRLPSLKEDESFHETKLYDGNWEICGVEMTLTKGRLQLVRLASIDLAFYAKFDALRTQVENMLVELRAIYEDDE